MKTKRLIFLSFLIVLYIAPVTFTPYSIAPTIVERQNIAQTEAWLTGFGYRQVVEWTDYPVLWTNIQLIVNVTYNSHMRSDFGDIRFTSDDNITELDYWLQSYVASTSAYFWVEVPTNYQHSSFTMYYGNLSVDTTSNGWNTFPVFFDKSNTSGWTTPNNYITVSTSGDFLRFYNPTASNGGECYRNDLTTPSYFQLMAQFKTVSLGSADNWVMLTDDGSSSHRLGQTYSPAASAQNAWKYYDGSLKSGGAWVEGTEFILAQKVDETDSSTGIDYQRYNTAWTLQDAIYNENFALGSPSDCDGIYMGDASGSATCDVYVRWMAVRKLSQNADQPYVSSFSSEEAYSGFQWNLIDAVSIYLRVPFDYWALDMGLILVGLAMAVFSTCYIAYKVTYDRSNVSLNTGLIVILLFLFGWGLFFGGIF